MAKNLEEQIKEKQAHIEELHKSLGEAKSKLSQAEYALPRRKRKKRNIYAISILFVALLACSALLGFYPPAREGLVRLLNLKEQIVISMNTSDGITCIVGASVWIFCCFTCILIGQLPWLHFALMLAAAVFYVNQFTPFTFVLADIFLLPVTIKAIIEDIDFYKSRILYGVIDIKTYASKVAELENKIPRAENELSALKAALTEAIHLYRQGVANNDDNLIQQSAQKGYQKAKDYSNEKKAKEICKSGVTSSQDRQGLLCLAKAGSVTANLFIGKEFLEKGISDQYTNQEKTVYLKEAKEHFRIAYNKGNVEGNFLYMLCCILIGNNSTEELESMLKRAREIKEKHLLPENYEYNIEYLIENLVRAINSKKTIVIDYEDFAKRADAEYKRMLGIDDSPIPTYVDINTGLPL